MLGASLGFDHISCKMVFTGEQTITAMYIVKRATRAYNHLQRYFERGGRQNMCRNRAVCVSRSFASECLAGRLRASFEQVTVP